MLSSSSSSSLALKAKDSTVDSQPRPNHPIRPTATTTTTNTTATTSINPTHASTPTYNARGSTDALDDSSLDDYSSIVDTPTAAADRAARLEQLLRGAVTNEDQANQDCHAAATNTSFHVDDNDRTSGDSTSRFDPTPLEWLSEDRASLYSELHSYLDQLQTKIDLAHTHQVDNLSNDVTRKAVVKEFQPQQDETNDNHALTTTTASSSTISSIPSPSSRSTLTSPSHKRLPTSSLSPSLSIETNLAESQHRPLSRATNSLTSPSSSHGSQKQSNQTEEKSFDAHASSSDFNDVDNADADADASPIDPSTFDELKEMEKIAALDQLLADADARSAELEQRLRALMGAPLPQIEGASDGGVNDGLMLLMPGSSSSSASVAASHLPPATTGGDFFITSVPGVFVSNDGPTSPSSASVTTPDDVDNKRIGSSVSKDDSLTPAKEDPSIWLLEEVEELDAPIIVANGEGFRPSQEDQVKLNEIDASVQPRLKFRSTHIRLRHQLITSIFYSLFVIFSFFPVSCITFVRVILVFPPPIVHALIIRQ